MEYTKTAKSISDLIAMLQERGLTISDTGKAQDFFRKVSYFRIAAYPEVDVNAMGFPAAWQNEPLWK